MSGVNATSSAVELTDALRSKEVSSRELLGMYLERIERLDRGGVNAVVTLDVDHAGDAAAAAVDRELNPSGRRQQRLVDGDRSDRSVGGGG